MAVRALVQARNYTPGRRKPVRLVVVHDMEAPERASTAESIAAWFSTTTKQASAHDCIDGDSVVPCVRDEDTAWAAPGANSDGIQLELAGYAAQTIDEWLDAYGKQLLDLAAQRTALRCTKYGIPVRRLSPAQIRDGVTKGIVGHWDVTKAFPELGTGHTDPGSGFPWSYFLALVRHYVGGDEKPPTRPATPLRLDGVLGTLTIRRWQSFLNTQEAVKPKLRVDGDLGPKTWLAVDQWLSVHEPNGTPGGDTIRPLQRRLGVEADGKLGPATINALQAFLNRRAA